MTALIDPPGRASAWRAVAGGLRSAPLAISGEGGRFKVVSFDLRSGRIMEAVIEQPAAATLAGVIDGAASRGGA